MLAATESIIVGAYGHKQLGQPNKCCYNLLELSCDYGYKQQLLNLVVLTY